MEFCKKILDWTFLIAKIIFAIVLIIIGVKFSIQTPSNDKQFEIAL